MPEELDPARVMKVINHPVRLKIIELLATRGPLTWKELSKELGTGTGALYYHLDALERIVTRDAMKRYALTKLGVDIHLYLGRNPSPKDPKSLTKVIQPRTALGTVKNFFAPRSLIRTISATGRMAIASGVAVSAILVILSLLSGVQVTLFSFAPASSPVFSVVTVVGSVLALGALAYLAGRGIFKQKTESLPLFSSSALSLLPLTAFSVILHQLDVLGSLGILADKTVLTIVLAFFQGWGVTILSAGTSVSTGMRIERTLMFGLVLLYVSMSILFIQGKVL